MMTDLSLSLTQVESSGWHKDTDLYTEALI